MSDPLQTFRIYFMPEKPRKRLDVPLVERGLFPSRSKAREAVLEGQVYVDGSRADKAGAAVSIDADMEVNEQGERYVSRGGRKLEAALDHFPIKIEGRVALDVGASTGGFTDCLLKAGVKRVFALDVGQGLIDESLRRDVRYV